MRRKHTTTACQICRESKTKCDGIRPICGSCRRKNKPCQYSTKDDKRKLSLRTAVEILFSRVEQLTILANKHNIEVPRLCTEEQSLLEQICVTLELPSTTITAPVQDLMTTTSTGDANVPPLSEPLLEVPLYEELAAVNGAEGIGSSELAWDASTSTNFGMQNWTELFTTESWDGSPSDWPWQVLNDFSGTAMLTADQSTTQLQPKSDIHSDAGRSSASPENEVEADIVPRLAARFGSLRVGADGQLRYYGTASNYHFLSNLRQIDRVADLEESEQAARSALETAHLDQDPPLPLLNHLLELFFTWHNPTHFSVDMDMFKDAQSRVPNELQAYCSPSLINAMCAIGAAFEARYHQSFVTFPKPLADFFAERSRIHLELEFDSPCISTVQALLLLSSHEAGAGRDSRMWLYGGMAARLAFDIGLHVDSGPYVEQGLMTPREADVRRSTFWSCVCVNQLWSFSMGRPFRIDSEEITVEIPSDTMHSTSIAGWTNSVTDTDRSQMDVSKSWDSSSIAMVSSQWISLSEEIAPLIRVLYGCVKISKAALQKLSVQTTDRLDRWQDSIPDPIKIQSGKTPPPHVLLLHMGYHNFCILIHRPWTSKTSQPAGKIGPGHQHARAVCRNSAFEIANLLRDYEAQYGFRRMNVYIVNIIFSASLILIFGLIAEEISSEQYNQKDKTNIARDLNTCFRALDELGYSFESAKRNHEHLLAIQKHWSQRKRDAKAGAKRKNRDQGQSSSASQKRVRSHENSDFGHESFCDSIASVNRNPISPSTH